MDRMDKYMLQEECKIYKRYHNTIDGTYSTYAPKSFEDIEVMEETEWIFNEIGENEEILKLFSELTIYNKEYIADDKMNLLNIPDATVFIIEDGDKYYFCETQGYKYLKFIINITDMPLLATSLKRKNIELI